MTDRQAIDQEGIVGIIEVVDTLNTTIVEAEEEEVGVDIDLMTTTVGIMEITMEDTMEVTMTTTMGSSIKIILISLTISSILLKINKKHEESKVSTNVKSFLHDKHTVISNLEKLSSKGIINVLMVSEKPSIAKTIAQILSDNKAKESKGGFKPWPVWNYDGDFKGFEASFKVTSVTGHMYSRDFPKKVDTWKINPKTLFKEETIQNPSSIALWKHIQSISKNIDVLLLWLDCDREGENICFEVIDNIKGSLKYPKEDYIFRAKFSSLAAKDIKLAYENIMHKPNEYESKSVEARQIIDLKIGVAFSVFQTKHLLEKYPIIANTSKTISYGPCQFPTLGFCIERAERIKKFKPEPFWYIDVFINYGDDSILNYNLKWLRKKMFNKECCEAIHDMISSEGTATAVDIKEEYETQNKPLGLNTVKLLKVASSAFGMSAHATMRAAEHLYLSGYISYPRTESTAYSSNFNFTEILNGHKDHSEWGTYVWRLLDEGHENPRHGKDAGDHPPITPVKCAKEEWLSEQEWKVYKFIAQNFLATISKPAVFRVNKVKLRIGYEYFQLKGKILESEGFLEITPWLINKIKEVGLPTFQIDEEYKIDSMHVREGHTSAPGYLTESDLISCMEANEIGTDASIPSHIKNIIDRGYVRVVVRKGRTLIPSNLGLALARGYCDIDSELILPKVRRYIEKSVDRVAKGEIDFQLVVDHVLKIFLQKYDHYVGKMGVVDNYIKTDFLDKIGTEKDDAKPKGKEKGFGKDQELLGNPEDYKSYEHCTVYTDYKESVVEK